MSASPSSPPSRTLEQRNQALSRANDIRKKRATDKKKIKKRQLDARKLLAAPPEHWYAARVADLMLAVPAVGHKKVETMLRRLQISPAKTLGGMTDSQRDRLSEALGRFYGQEL
jgi:hypothetical protein